MSTTSPTRRAHGTRSVPADHDRERALHEAEVAYQRFVDAVASLTPGQWEMPTECTGWDIRTMAGHVLGAMRAAASLMEFASQQIEVKRRSRRSEENDTDLMTEIQVERTASLSPSDLVAELGSLVGPAARGRRGTPGPMRRLVSFPVEVPGMKERWNLGYLVDIILTRDAWMHRIDVARALGSEPLLTADHDGWIVAGVAQEWLDRHGQPVDLVLEGPAGGRFGDPTAEAVCLDAVEFCRITSKRAPGEGLLQVAVPF
jgi:uncharacterized protein (TIGR03083 family)